MATKYSILSAILRHQIGEKLSVGLLLTNNEGEMFFAYSKDKLAAAKHLMNDAARQLLREGVRNITLAMDKEKLSRRNQLRGLEGASPFGADYIAYLSRYNNNILSFSQPKEIDLPCDALSFKHLYALYVDNIASVENPVQESRIERFLATHEQRLERHFNRNRQITAGDVKSLIVPVKVDAVGVNKRPVIVQFLDLNRRLNDIKYELGQVLLLEEAFEEQNRRPKTFLVTEVPAQALPEQEAIWKQLLAHKKFDSIPVTEAEKVLQYAEEHNVLPLLQEQATL